MCDNETEQIDLVRTLQSELSAAKKRAALHEAFDILRLRLALDKIDGAGQNSKMASGVMIEITDLNGQGITGRFGVVDGLSSETIAAIKSDLERTFMMRIDVNTPTSLRKNVELMFRSVKE